MELPHHDPVHSQSPIRLSSTQMHNIDLDHLHDHQGNDHIHDHDHDHDHDHEHTHEHTGNHTYDQHHENLNGYQPPPLISHSHAPVEPSHSHSHSHSHTPSHSAVPMVASTSIKRILTPKRKTSLTSHLIGTLPVLTAFPSILLSAYLSHVPSETTSLSVLSIVSLLTLLSAAFLLIAKILVNFNVIGNDTGAELKIRSTKSSTGTTCLLLVAGTLIYTSVHLLHIPRVSVLILGLYLNQFNLYTLIAFIIDCSSTASTNTSISHVFLGYFLVIASFRILYKKLVTKSAISTISQLNLNLLIGSLLVAVFITAFLATIADKGFGVAMLGVNICASFILLISLQDCQLRIPFVNSILVSAISLVLEYVVLGAHSTPFTVLLKISLPAIIQIDDSVELREEVVEKDQSLSDNDTSNKSTSIIKDVLLHSDTRAIFNFLLLNSAFMFIQLLYSFRSKSLGLLSDSLHMALDCTSLALGLIAGTLLKNPIDINGKYPFGLKNFEILAGFTNGTLLIGISGSIIFEAVGRLWNPVTLQKTNELIIVSFLGLLVNLVGIFAFNHGHGGEGGGHSHGHSHSHAHSHSHGAASNEDDNSDSHMNDNMRGIFLHILADTLGSVGVVISTILTKVFKWEGFDPVASIVIAVLIFLSAIPLIKSTAGQLLLSTDTKKEKMLRSVLENLTEVKGVKSYTTPRFWPSNDCLALTGYIHVQIYRGENTTYIKKQIERLFDVEDILVTLQIENDYDDCWCRSDSAINPI